MHSPPWGGVVREGLTKRRLKKCIIMQIDIEKNVYLYKNIKDMYREKLKDLEVWKKSKNRKPLILRGARQVGKTWLLKEFGKNSYEHTVYLNFEKDSRLVNLFEVGLDIPGIIGGIQAVTGKKIHASNTLLIFDEIQSVPPAVTSLKYFAEDAPEYHIAAAGSLLGIALTPKVSFPVGKVEFMDLNPLTFSEFLDANGEGSLSGILTTPQSATMKALHAKLIRRLKEYYYTGGMPEAVEAFAGEQDFVAVRRIQKDILQAFEQDFSKHAPNSIIPRIRMLWNSIPSQLARENRKFMYGIIRTGARAKEYELALNWLEDCRLVTRVNRVNRPGIPLKAYEDPGAFKLFTLDTGLLGALCDLEPATLLDGNAIFTEFKGALTEQFVFQQLFADSRFVIRYWSAERSTAEVDFIVQCKDRVYPVEVKAEEHLQAKSLKVYYEKYHPLLAVRTSVSDYRLSGWLMNIPLYAIGNLREFVG